jgi:DNA-binding transcriptional LysR family regulator
MRLLYSRHLEHFLAIYQAGSLRRAAEASGVTQPALTKSLRVLESALSVSLFERQATGVVPTQAGDLLGRYARHMVNSGRYLEMEIGMLRGGEVGTLRVGSGMAWSVTRMPQLLADLHARFPQLEISLQTGVSEQLTPRLLDGDLDVVFASLPRQPLPKGFRTIRLADAEMVVFARRKHRLAKRRNLRLDELVDFDFAGFAEDQDWQRHAELAFGMAHASLPRTILRSTSLETLLATVAASDSLAILSESLADRAAASGLVKLRLFSSAWRIPMGISFHEQSAELTPLRELLRLAQA